MPLWLLVYTGMSNDEKDWQQKRLHWSDMHQLECWLCPVHIFLARSTVFKVCITPLWVRLQLCVLSITPGVTTQFLYCAVNGEELGNRETYHFSWIICSYGPMARNMPVQEYRQTQIQKFRLGRWGVRAVRIERPYAANMEWLKDKRGWGLVRGCVPSPENFWNFSWEMVHFTSVFKVQMPIAQSDILEVKPSYRLIKCGRQVKD